MEIKSFEIKYFNPIFHEEAIVRASSAKSQNWNFQSEKGMI